MLIEDARFGTKTERDSTRFQQVWGEAEVAWGFKLNWDKSSPWARKWEYPYALLHSDVKKDDFILDAGCGFTAFKVLLSKRTNNLYCLDSDKDVGTQIMQINSLLNREIAFTNANIRNIPYPSNYFTTVFCISVLEHNENYFELMEELLRVTEEKLVVTLDVNIPQRKVPWNSFFTLPVFKQFCSKYGISIRVPPEHKQIKNEGRGFIRELFRPSLGKGMRVFGFTIQK